MGEHYIEGFLKLLPKENVMPRATTKKVWKHSGIDRVDKVEWDWIGSFAVHDSVRGEVPALNRVPQWVRKVIEEMEGDWWEDAIKDVYYVINGKVYSYAVVPYYGTYRGDWTVGIWRRLRERIPNTPKNTSKVEGGSKPNKSLLTKLRSIFR